MKIPVESDSRALRLTAHASQRPPGMRKGRKYLSVAPGRVLILAAAGGLVRNRRSERALVELAQVVSGDLGLAASGVKILTPFFDRSISH